MKQKLLSCLAVLLTLAFLPLGAFVPAVSGANYVFPDDWSHDALVFAVENGIFQGDERGNLRPDDNITRAEMAAVLVRLLGAGETADLSAYTDCQKDDWFYDELSRAVAAGIFTGTSKTTMDPDLPITREQSVAVFARAFGLTSSQEDIWQSFRDKNELSDYAKDYLCALVELGGVTGYGDGTFRPQNPITRAEVASILYHLFDAIADAPEEIPARGFVLYRGSAALGDGLSLDGTLIIGQGIEPAFSVQNWQISDAVILRTGSTTDAVLENLQTEKLVCAPLSGTVTGHAPEVWLWSSRGEYRGSAQQLFLVDGEQRVTGAQESVVLRGGHLTLDSDVQLVRLLAGTRLTLNASANSVILDGIGATVDGSGHIQTLTQNRGGCSCSVHYDTLEDEKYQSYYKDHDSALETVQTQRVACQVTANTRLYADRFLSGYLCDVPKGATVYNEHHPHGGVCMISYTDSSGKLWKGWISDGCCTFPSVDTPTWDSSMDYSNATKEGFVNLQGYSSKTDYLIWVSRYTQRVVIFTGEKGNWKVKQTFLCSSGANSCPTPQGVYAIEAHYGTWHFSNYQVYTPTGFWGDFAFHSTPYRYDGSYYDNRLGMPLSKGCIRMNAEEAAYIYNTMPMGTTVVIW